MRKKEILRSDPDSGGGGGVWLCALKSPIIVRDRPSRSLPSPNLFKTRAFGGKGSKG